MLGVEAQPRSLWQGTLPSGTWLRRLEEEALYGGNSQGPCTRALTGGWHAIAHRGAINARLLSTCLPLVQARRVPTAHA